MLIVISPSPLEEPVMNLSSTPLRRSVAAALAIPFVTGPVTVRAALDDAVLLWGKTTAEETMLTASFNGRSARLDTGLPAREPVRHDEHAGHGPAA